jgi:DNA-binding Xre family transcriptional regulator
VSVFPKPLAVTKDTVVLSRKDWKAVVEALEDAADRAAVRGSEKRRAAGEDDGLAAELYRRLLVGDHPIRVWRAQRNMSLAKLARRAAVAPAYLSEIETGKKPGSVSALQKIARALEVDLGDLVPRAQKMSRSGRSVRRNRRAA